MLKLRKIIAAPFLVLAFVFLLMAFVISAKDRNDTAGAWWDRLMAQKI